jgi:TrmH family RNA methyltransferase
LVVVPRDRWTRSIPSEERPGVLVVARQHWQSLPSVVLRNDLWLGVEHLRTPGNVGTLMRSAAAVGATGLIVSCPARDRTDPFDPGAVRASMGAIFGFKMVRTSHAEFRRWPGRPELRVFGGTGDAPRDYRSVIYRKPVVLMLGNER